MPPDPLPPFESVLELYGPAVLRYCVARVGLADAEDCFQDVMLAALGAYDKVKDPVAIRSWLLTIASNKASDQHRAGFRERKLVGALSAAVLPVEPPVDTGTWDEVSELPVKQREAVTLRYLADLTNHEIAAVMGTSPGAARRNVFEGLTRLRTNRTEAEDAQQS